MRLVLILAFALAALAASVARADAPRVVSLDYCADQYVLALSDRADILATSTGAADAWSALRDRAEGVARLRNTHEDVISRDPDLIVRSYGGGPRALSFYERLDYPVHELGFASSFEAIKHTIRETARVLGHADRGDALVAHMEAQLNEASRRGWQPAVLYVTPGGVTTGAGTLVHDILVAAGFENIAARGGATGWRELPLEALVLDPPELVVTGFFSMPDEQMDAWSLTRHPVLRELLAQTPTVHLDGAHLACGTWFVAEAALDARTQADAVWSAKKAQAR